MSQHDTHWLNRQTPVPGKPGGQPGTTARLSRYRHRANVPLRQPPADRRLQYQAPGGQPGTGPSATWLRFRHQPKSNPDTHQLNRQTPVPDKPGGQPGTGPAATRLRFRHRANVPPRPPPA